MEAAHVADIVSDGNIDSLADRRSPQESQETRICGSMLICWDAWIIRRSFYKHNSMRTKDFI